MLAKRTLALTLLLVIALNPVMPAFADLEAPDPTTGVVNGPTRPGALELATPGLAASSRYQVMQSETASQFMIHVQIWGQVSKPGLYVIPDDTGIVGLLSYAGGPAEGADLEGVRLIHADRSLQPTSVNLKDFIEHGTLDGAGSLHPGDVLMVPANRSQKLLRFTNLLTFVTLAANVIVLAVRK